MALQAEATQALPAVLVGQVEVPHQVFCGRLLHVELVGVLLVEEAHFLQTDKTSGHSWTSIQHTNSIFDNFVI